MFFKLKSMGRSNLLIFLTLSCMCFGMAVPIYGRIKDAAGFVSIPVIDSISSKNKIILYIDSECSCFKSFNYQYLLKNKTDDDIFVVYSHKNDLVARMKSEKSINRLNFIYDNRGFVKKSLRLNAFVGLYYINNGRVVKSAVAQGVESLLKEKTL
jgi:hypothetical protein